MRGKSATERAWDKRSSQSQAAHKIPATYIHYGPHCPTEDDLQLLGELGGKNVVELGCGGGQCSVAFAKRGAKVTGVDFSDQQLARARSVARKEGVVVEFIKASIEALTAIPDSSQDIAFSAYAFQFVSDLSRAFSEIYRVLRSGGIFVFSLDHPFYSCFPTDLSELKVVRSYFNDKSTENALGREYPRNLSELFNALFDSGFIVAKILEPEPVENSGDKDLWPEYPLGWLRMVPATVIFKALKPHGFSDLFQRKREDQATW